jgi:flavodoxin
MQDSARIIRGITEGLSPSQIAVDLNLPFNSVVQEINAAVHDGRLLRSQVQSTLNSEWLDALRTFAPAQGRFSPERIRDFIKQIYGLELSVEELKFCFVYAGKSFWAGETYELLCDIERTLHDQVKRILMEEIRASEDEVDVHHWDEAKETGWWRKVA